MAEVKEFNINGTVYDVKDASARNSISNLATVASSGSYNDLSNTPTIPTVNNATLTITQGGTTKGTFTANASSNVTIDLEAGGGSRNIGEIVQSTIPLTDAGLHLLDGSLISGSGSYADFVTYIAGFVSTYPSLFETEANWQSAVATYGVCGKYVYDSTNNTVRLPKYSNKIWSGGGEANSKGNGKTIGLTNGEENVGLSYASTNEVRIYTGAYDKNTGNTSTGTAQSSGPLSLGLTTDGSKSGIITDLSTITTALDGYWYIVVANSTKTEIEVDIDEIATDLNGKADVDLSNMNASQSAKNTIVSWCIPDYDAGISITLNSSNSYTAPDSGFVKAVINDDYKMFVNGEEVYYAGVAGSITQAYAMTAFVSKNDVVTTDATITVRSYFYPMKGVSNA